VVWDVRVPAPTQGLREPPARVRRLPAANQVELSVDPIEELALPAAEGAWIVGGAPPDGNVEVAAEDQISVALDVQDAVEDRVHRANVAALARGAVDAEDAHRPRRPPTAPDLPADDPAVELWDRDRCEPSRANEHAGPPTARLACRAPDEGVLGGRAEALAAALPRRPALLAEDDVRPQRSHDARPLAGALGAAPAQEVVGDKPKTVVHSIHCRRSRPLSPCK